MIHICEDGQSENTRRELQRYAEVTKDDVTGIIIINHRTTG